MKKNSILYFALFFIVLTSCVIKKTATPVSPINTQVLFNYDDLEYIGEVTGTSTQTYLFGVIPIGGRRNHQGVFAGSIISSPQAFNLNKRGINNALYDALSARPDADYIIPVSYKVTSQVSFGGRKETITIRAKVVKIRPKAPEPIRPKLEMNSETK